MVYVPTTIIVNSNPLFTDFLYTWLGRLAKPTYPSRDFDDSDRFTAGLWFSSLMSGFSAFGGGADFSIFSALPSLSRSDGSNFVEGASYLPPGVSPLRKASLLLIWKKQWNIQNLSALHSSYSHWCNGLVAYFLQPNYFWMEGSEYYLQYGWFSMPSPICMKLSNKECINHYSWLSIDPSSLQFLLAEIPFILGVWS